MQFLMNSSRGRTSNTSRKGGAVKLSGIKMLLEGPSEMRCLGSVLAKIGGTGSAVLARRIFIAEFHIEEYHLLLDLLVVDAVGILKRISDVGISAEDLAYV